MGMAQPDSPPAMASVTRRASHSREAELVPLMTSRNITGRHTGREQNGSVTMIPAITQLFPYPVLRGPFADPS